MKCMVGLIQEPEIKTADIQSFLITELLIRQLLLCFDPLVNYHSYEGSYCETLGVRPYLVSDLRPFGVLKNRVGATL